MVLEALPKLKLLVSFIIMFLFIITVNLNNRYAQSVNDYSMAKEIDNMIIEQIVQADEEGKDYVEVLVPKYNNKSNWPQPYNMATWLQNTLYSHNIIKNRLKIVFSPSDEIYEKYYKNKSKNYQRYFDFERDEYYKN